MKIFFGTVLIINGIFLATRELSTLTVIGIAFMIIGQSVCINLSIVDDIRRLKNETYTSDDNNSGGRDSDSGNSHEARQ